MNYAPITADNTELMRQAPMTADVYLRAAVRCIDDVLGKGYAAQHPELIGAFMQTAAVDLGASVVARALESVVSAIVDVAESNREQRP